MDARKVLAELRNENVLAAAGKATQDRGEPTVVQDALYEAADAARGRKLAAFGELRLAARARLAQLAGTLAFMIAMLAGAAGAGEKPVESPAERFCRQNPRGRDFVSDSSCPSGRRLVTCTPLGPQLAPCDAVRPGVQPATVSGDEWVECSGDHHMPVMCHGAGHGRCRENCPTKCSEGHPVACSCCRYAGSVSADNNWPDSWEHPGQPAAACKHPDGGEGLVPCCNDVTAAYSGKCGIERPEAPTMPKVPFKPAGETAGLRRP